MWGLSQRLVMTLSNPPENKAFHLTSVFFRWRTYAQTGAQFGYATTWTMPYCYPLMAAVQIISARLGRTTGRGIAGNIRSYYPASIVYSCVSKGFRSRPS
ncbi:MAG: divalent metal cation transporter [Phyllobacterium sp.]|uniref:divalent metal cation transporter n=1 Tax=Phyllobacterium sp. TaxID=1871046 RepID=UPI0030F0F1F7